MANETIKISEDDFYGKYKPKTNHILLADKDESTDESDIAPFGGKMYETFGPEQDYIIALSKDKKMFKHVWTIIEGDDGEFHAMPGVHVVNRFGYLVTERPWETGEEEVDFD
jgi:hypothetical protein